MMIRSKILVAVVAAICMVSFSYNMHAAGDTSKKTSASKKRQAKTKKPTKTRAKKKAAVKKTPTKRNRLEKIRKNITILEKDHAKDAFVLEQLSIMKGSLEKIDAYLKRPVTAQKSVKFNLKADIKELVTRLDAVTDQVSDEQAKMLSIHREAINNAKSGVELSKALQALNNAFFTIWGMARDSHNEELDMLCEKFDEKSREIEMRYLTVEPPF